MKVGQSFAFNPKGRNLKERKIWGAKSGKDMIIKNNLSPNDDYGQTHDLSRPICDEKNTYKKIVMKVVKQWTTGHPDCFGPDGDETFCADLGFKSAEFWGGDDGGISDCALDVLYNLGFDTDEWRVTDKALWIEAFSSKAAYEMLKSCFGDTSQNLDKMGMMSLLIGLANAAPAADCLEIAKTGFIGAPWNAVDVVDVCFPGGWLDMNGDGIVDDTDGVMVSQYPNGGAFREMANYWSGEPAVWGDCNNDGRRDYSDAVCIYYGGGDRSTFAHRSIYWNVAGAGPTVIMGVQAANAAYCETGNDGGGMNWANMHGGQQDTWHGITRDLDYLTEETVVTGKAHCQATGMMGYVAYHPILGCFAAPRGAVIYEYNGVYTNQIMTVVVEWVGMQWSQNPDFKVHSGFHDSIYGSVCDGTTPEAQSWGVQMTNLLDSCANTHLHGVDAGHGHWHRNVVTFIGHSMGGSVASLLAADWLWNLSAHSTEYTCIVSYGQARVFDEAFAGWVDGQASSFIRVTNRADYAPFVPYRGNGATGSGCAKKGPGALSSFHDHLDGCVLGSHPSYPDNPDFNFCGEEKINCAAAWYMSKNDCKWGVPVGGKKETCVRSGPNENCKNGNWQKMYKETIEYMFCGVDYVHSGDELHENAVGWVENVGGPDDPNGIMQHADNTDYWVCFHDAEHDAHCFWGFGQYGSMGIAPHALHLHTVQPGCWSNGR